jgi:hypothetical protein
MQLNLIRWDSVVRKAGTLYPQLCTWGGFKTEILAFVPADSSWVQRWKIECAKHHKVKRVPSFYTLELSSLTYDQFIKESLKEYSQGTSKLTRLGIFVTLEEMDRGYEVVEVRFNQPSPLQYLKDT